MSNYPPCFADPDEYDIEDEGCTECPFVDACGIRIARNSANKRSDTRTFTSGTSNKRTSSYYRPPPSRSQSNVTNRSSPPKKVEQDPDENDTWSSVLMFNASIEMAQAMVDELSESVRAVPRKSYNKLWTRKKQ